MSKKCYRFFGGLLTVQKNWLNKMAEKGYRLIRTGKLLYEEANGKRGEEIIISTPDSKVKVLVVPTNEELAIARETVALV